MERRCVARAPAGLSPKGRKALRTLIDDSISDHLERGEEEGRLFSPSDTQVLRNMGANGLRGMPKKCAWLVQSSKLGAQVLTAPGPCGVKPTAKQLASVKRKLHSLGAEPSTQIRWLGR